MNNHPNRSRAKKAVAAANTHDHEADYAALLASVRAGVADGSVRFFTTDAHGLYALYLDNLPAERDVHTCTACRQFIERFGSLVTIDEHGKTTSAFWRAGNAPIFYMPAVAAMQRAAERARVTGPFLSVERTWGLPRTGDWTHFSVTAPPGCRYTGKVLSAGQTMAARREDFRTVAAALADFAAPTLTEAVRILEADGLTRSERFVAPMRWLLALQAARAAAKDSRRRDNLLWRAVAVAPEGYCHPRASMTGTLLEDIAAGLSFEDVKRRFDAKMHPLQYQRPQAAPAAGAIAAAERTAQQLGLAPSLERRYARLDEVEAIWREAPPKEASGAGGVFGHLTPKGAAEPGALAMPAVTMTWEKFARTVLPGALAIKAHVPYHGNFLAFTTAVHADAPPLMRWDREDRRNPFAWYLWHGGSDAPQWGLRSGWCNVPALALFPTMWGDQPSPHLGEGVLIILEGALDTRTGGGNCIFPETIRQELHGVRSVVEAYSRRASLGAPGGPAACGLDLRKGGPAGYVLRVTSVIGQTDYRIDRWD